MNNCTYNYKGHLFSSELELDDFLLERGHLVSKYGDMVFSTKSVAMNAYDKILKVKLDAETIKKGNKESGKNDIEPVNITSQGHIGVNDFLKGLRNLELTLLFPEFDIDNYWENTKPRWAGGKFDKEEIDAIFGKDSLPHPITSEQEFEMAKNIIEDKWKHQGLIGTELHTVMQKFFSKSKEGTEMRTLDDTFLVEKYLPQFINSDLVPPKILKSMVAYCRKLEKNLTQELGEDLIFLPETAVSGITSLLDEAGNPKTLVGIIDLLVIDKKGNVHIIDYKTSPKPYYRIGELEGYDPAKIRTFKYQLGVYDRLLRKNEINTSSSKLFVAPILLENFRKLDDEWVYDDVLEYQGITVDLTSEIKNDLNIQGNIDEFLPAPYLTKANTEDLLQNVTSTMAKLFPKYNSNPLEITDDLVRDLLKEQHSDTPNPETGKYVFKSKYSRDTLKADTFEELFGKVKKKMVRIANSKIDLTQSIKTALTKAIEEENPYYEFTKDERLVDPKSTTGWFNREMSRYCNRNWEIVDCPSAEYLGCILLRNKISNQINLIKISTSLLYRPMEIVKDRHTLFSAFYSDSQAVKKSNSFAAENIVGNIELIEAMLVLNNLSLLFKENAIVGEVRVYNPIRGESIPMENKLLLDCFNELDHLVKFPSNNFKTGDIKLSKLYDLFYRRFKEIISDLPNNKNYKTLFGKFSSAINTLDSIYENPVELRLELKKLRDEFMEAFPNIGTISDYDPLRSPLILLYRMLNLAIGELDGLDYTQITKESKEWIDNFNVAIHGLSGLKFDNPGNLNNPLLNKLTSLVTTAYQNVRDEVSRKNEEIRKLVNDLKNDLGFTYLKERTIGNLADLYKGMIEYTEDGDILLKNPDDPRNGFSPAQQKFLKYFLETINHNRYPDKTEEELTEWRLSGNENYYRLPLTLGSSASISSAKGILGVIKDKLQDWNPKKVKERLINKVEGFLDPEDEKYKSALKGELWEMTNIFDAGENLKVRQSLIEEKGKEYFETNLETLLIKHISAYSMKENIDEIFPSLLAIAFHVSESGMSLNTKFDADLLYILDYIKNKVFNQSLIDDRAKVGYMMSRLLMGIASKLALVFNPSLYYQFIDAAWKDISLIIRKPDGNTSFTKLNVTESFKFALRDMVHFGNNISLCEALNMLYGINDMDMNTYSDKIKSDLTGFWNFWSLGFRCSSRPDYYNRMTIFGAQMRGDGCWEAHSIVDGKLVYDWKKDKRFDAFANGNKSDPRYKQLEALYYSVALLMVKEHTKNADGTMFRVGQPLPKAYTVQQSEGHKALADSIYGYYSHEKKSLFQSTFIGSLLFQMNTYWSSKKNQFLAPEGIKLQGRYVLLEKDGKKWYHKLNSKGEITQEATDEDTGYPFMVWEGRWEEGIILTLMKVASGIYLNGLKLGNIRNGIDYVINDIWNNEDELLRRLYRSNLKLLLYDLFMLIFVGGLAVGSLTLFVKNDIKERGNDTLGDAVANTGLELSTRMLKASTDDFNFFKSIFGRGMNWTPFTILTLNRTIDTFSNVVSGDSSLYLGLINTAAATRSTKPFWDYIDPTKEEE